MIRFRGLFAMFVGVGVICATSLLQAQQRGGEGDRSRRSRGGGMMSGFMSGTGGALMLLRNEQIQKELELVDEQKEKLNKLAEEAMEEMRTSMRERFGGGGGDLTPEERRAQWEERRAKWEKMSEEDRRAEIDKMRKDMESRADKLMKKVEGILLPHQIDRLKQVQLQVQTQMGGRGGSITSNPKVVDALKLTEEQKAKLQKIREEYDKKRGETRSQWLGLREMEPEEREAKIKQLREDSTKLRKETEEKALAVLTKEQRTKLEKMIGKKFEFDWSQMRRGRGGRSGGGRPEGGRPN